MANRSGYRPPVGSGVPSIAGATTEPASHSNLQLYNQNIPPSGSMVLDSGSFFFLLSAAATVNVTVSYNGPTEQFQGCPVGLQLQRVKTWKSLTISGTPGSAVEFIHGYSFTRQDYTNFQATIATIVGAVTVSPSVGTPNALTYHADVLVASATLDTTIAANALRKFIIIGSSSYNEPNTYGNLRIQGLPGTAANEGIELQPGTSYQIQSSAGFAIYNPANVGQTYWYVEQT